MLNCEITPLQSQLENNFMSEYQVVDEISLIL